MLDAKAGCLYPNNARALHEAKRGGFDNCLLCDLLGNVAELATCQCLPGQGRRGVNRPQRMTDGTKTVVWDAIYKPFGEVYAITGSATLNLRFPGQYFLIENGLAYNWYRHYDPTIGRYTQPDPLFIYVSRQISADRQAESILPVGNSATLFSNLDPPEFGDGGIRTPFSG